MKMKKSKYCKSGKYCGLIGNEDRFYGKGEKEDIFLDLGIDKLGF